MQTMAGFYEIVPPSLAGSHSPTLPIRRNEGKSGKRASVTFYKEFSFLKTREILGACIGLALPFWGAYFLSVIGFSAAGPVASSFAASWMSAAAVASGGGIQVGSVYAIIQSATMTGTLTSAEALVISCAAGISTAWASRFRRTPFPLPAANTRQA